MSSIHMKQLVSTVFLTGLFVAVCSYVIAQETGAPSDTPITNVDCNSAWRVAPANSSCTTIVLEAERRPGDDFVNVCAVKANCASTDGGDHDTFSDYHGGPEGVAELRNCSGVLSTVCPGDDDDALDGTDD